MPVQPVSLLITAGPTIEPIDAVRYIANRSSGRMGIAIAEAAAARGHRCTLLLGPTQTPSECLDTHIRVVRFQTTDDLLALLHSEWPQHDVLIMAAAVADYRPVPRPDAPRKHPRRSGRLSLELEPTPDLIAEMAQIKRPGQRIIGFALEAEDRLVESASRKLIDKRLDAIVANPLETMGSTLVSGRVLTADGQWHSPAGSDEPITKERFAEWLIDFIPRHLPAAQAEA